MRLGCAELNTKEFRREIERFLHNTSRKHWRKLISQFNQTDGLYAKEYLQIRNPLMEPLNQYFLSELKGKSIWKNPTEGMYYLAGTAFIINRAIHMVSDRGKRQIRGKLRSDDIRSFLFEVTMLAHFFRHGFDVKFVEYERLRDEGRTFDFLISKGSIEAEVECKWKSYDAGRKIKRDGFYHLCDQIVKLLNTYNIRILLEVRCVKALGKNLDTFLRLANSIKDAIDKKKTKIIFEENILIRVKYLPLEVIIKTEEQVAKIIEPYRTAHSHFTVLSNKEMTIIIKIASEEKDVVLRTIYGGLKDSLGQFSGNRPALIACCIEGIYPEQWEELKSDSGLAAMTTHLINKENTTNIHTVAYSSDYVESTTFGGITDNSRPVLFFRNKDCEFSKDQDIFYLREYKD